MVGFLTKHFWAKVLKHMPNLLISFEQEQNP